MLGVYGVVAYFVSRRTREMGIRIALGACRSEILGLVLRQSMMPVLLGIGLGLVVSFAFSHLISSMLYGIHPHDPVTFFLMPFFLAAAASLAGYIPARRATKVDPVLAFLFELLFVSDGNDR